jgi:hypothetical protein
MLAIQIALGIVLACVLLQVAPLLLSAFFVAIAHPIAFVLRVLATPLPPFWRNPANKKRGPNPIWVTALIVGAGALAGGLLSVLAFLSACLGA